MLALPKFNTAPKDDDDTAPMNLKLVNTAVSQNKKRPEILNVREEQFCHLANITKLLFVSFKNNFWIPVAVTRIRYWGSTFCG